MSVILRPSDKKNIFVTGVFISLLLGMAMAFIFMLSSDSSLFSHRIIAKTRLNNAQNLKTGAAVQFKGIKIGSISNIEIEKIDSIVISFTVNSQAMPFVKSDSHLSIRTQGVLGDKFIEILGGSEESSAINDGDFITTQEDGGFDKILGHSEDMLTVAVSVMTKIDTLLTEIEHDSLSSVLKDLKFVMSDLKKANLGQTVQNMSLASRDLQSISSSLSDISAQIQRGPGTMHSLIYDRSLYDDLASVIDGSKRNKILKYFIRETIKSSEK